MPGARVAFSRAEVRDRGHEVGSLPERKSPLPVLLGAAGALGLLSAPFWPRGGFRVLAESGSLFSFCLCLHRTNSTAPVQQGHELPSPVPEWPPQPLLRRELTRHNPSPALSLTGTTATDCRGEKLLPSALRPAGGLSPLPRAEGGGPPASRGLPVPACPWQGGGGWGGTLRAFRPVVRAARVRGSERPRAEPAFAFSRRGAWAPRSLNQPHGGPMGPLAASGLLGFAQVAVAWQVSLRQGCSARG